VKNIFEKYLIKAIEVLVVIFLFFLNNAYSAKIHPDAGTTSASFLKIPVGAKASAMGGGFSAFPGYIYSFFYNPSSAASIERKVFSFSHNIYFNDISQYVLVYGFNPYFIKDKKDYLSFSLNYINYGSMEKRSGLYETDPFSPSSVEGSFKAKDMEILMNYSFFHSKDTMLGGNIKFISESIENENGRVFSADIGGIKKANIKNRDFYFGLSILNIGTKIKMISEGYSLPLAFKIGVSTKFNKSLLSFDMLKYSDNYPYLILGFENNIAKDLYIRLGYRYRIYGNELGFWSGFSSGFGFDYNDFSFGYSLNSYGDLGYSHKIELTVKYK